MPKGGSSVWGAVIDRDGHLWFSDGNNLDVDRVEDDGSLAVHHVGFTVEGLAAALDGGVWAATFGYAGVAHIASDGTVALVPLAMAQSGARWVAATADGSVWLAGSNDVQAITRLLPSGALVQVAVGGFPTEPVVLGDGAVWFADWDLSGAWHIDRVGLDGALTRFAPPSGTDFIERLSAGHDGSLVFAYRRAADEGWHVARRHLDGTTESWDVSQEVWSVADTSSGDLYWSGQGVLGIVGSHASTEPVALDISRLIQATDGRLWFADGRYDSYGSFAATLL